MTGFLLFEGDDYYPRGGWGDFTGAYPTLEAAQEAKVDHQYDGGWAHVVDATLGAVVSHKDRLEPWRDGAPPEWVPDEWEAS